MAHNRLDVRQISIHVRRFSTTSFASSSRNEACPSRSGSQLSSSIVSSANESPTVSSPNENLKKVKILIC